MNSGQHLQAELEERLRFETLIADLSLKFINLPADDVDREIIEAERQICECLGLDVAGLWQATKDTPDRLTLTHLYGTVSAPIPTRMEASEFFPWYEQQMLAGRVVSFSTWSDLPSEARRDAEVFRRLGILSNLTVPLSAGGKPALGALGFNTTRAEREWPEPLVKRLHLVAQIFSNALARKRADEVLKESEARLGLAADAAGAGLWSLDLDTKCFWFTPKTRQLLGFGPEEQVTFDLFLGVVHPDDRPLINQTLERLITTGDEGHLEYRIIMPDGTVQWMLARGRVQCDVAGKPAQLMGVSTQVTERKRIEEAFRMSEARLAAGTDLAGLGYYEVDYGSGCCYMDERLRAICGISADVQAGLDPYHFWVDHVHPKDIELLLRIQKELHQGKAETISAEYRYNHPHHGQRWLHHAARLAGTSASGKGARTFGVLRDITENKRLSERLHQAAEEWRTTFDSLSDMVMILDRECRITQVNAAATRFFGASAEDMVGKPCYSVMHGTSCPIEGCPCQNTFQDQRIPDREVFHQASGKWLLLSTDVIRDAEGNLAGAVHVGRDITESKAMAKLQEQDLQFWRLIGNLSSRFVNLPPNEVDAAIEDAQRQVCEFLGLDLSALWQPVAEVAGDYQLTHHYRTVQGPVIERMSAIEKFPWCHSQLMASQLIAVSSMAELPPEAARDREVWQHFGVKTSLTLPLSAGADPSIGFLSFNDIHKERDWTETLVQRLQIIAQIFTNALARKRSDESLRESEEINRATFEQAAVGIAHLTTDGRWLRLNDKFCTILGYSREELLQLNFQDLTHPDDLETDLSFMKQVLNGEIKAYAMTKRYIRKDRSVAWANLSVSLVLNERGEPKHFISIVEDITERKQTEAELLRERVELAHVARVSTMGELAASVAHELNQPLGAILANAEAAELFLEQQPPALDELRAILADIRKDDERAGEVIRRMRTLLRKNEMERRPLSLNSLVEDVLSLVSGDAALRGIALRADLHPGLPEVSGDRVHLQQVLLNLIINGMDAVAGQERGRRLICVRTRVADNMVELSVSDSGHGIKPDKMKQLFEPFYTTKPSGMGMGLSIARTIVNVHHGRIWGENDPAGGAVFRVVLPALNRTTEQIAGNGDVTASAKGGGAKGVCVT